MRLPRFNDLIDEQKRIFEHPPDSPMLVVGPPGSGKTSMAIWRARLLTGPDLNKSVVLVTRNRLLAAAAGQLTVEQVGAGIRTTTMHQLIWRSYRLDFGRNAPQLEPYVYDWEGILRDYEIAQKHPTVDHMIIDEGQNLPPGFFRWAVRFGARVVSIFADEAQATHVGGSCIRDFASLGFATVLPLLVNHRNTAEIVDLLTQLHAGTVPRAAPSRGRGAERPRVIEVASWEALADTVAARLANRAQSIGVIVYRQDDVALVRHLLRNRVSQTARIDSYTSNSQRGAEHAIKMRDSGVTILSSESAIGLEFDALYLQDLDRSLPFTESIQRRRLYMLCARARDSLMLVNGPHPLSEAQLAALPPENFLER